MWVEKEEKHEQRSLARRDTPSIPHLNWLCPGRDSPDRRGTGTGHSPIESPLGSQQDAQKGGTLKVAIIGEPPALDPSFTTAGITASTMWHVFEGLFTRSSRHEPISPSRRALRRRPGRRRFIFYIRKGAFPQRAGIYRSGCCRLVKTLGRGDWPRPGDFWPRGQNRGDRSLYGHRDLQGTDGPPT